MVDLSILRRIWNNRHYRNKGGWKAPGISKTIKAATASALIADGLVYENTAGRNPFIDLTDAGKAKINMK